jgi:starch synthase
LLAVVNDALYDRPGGPYQGPDGHDYADNAIRFGLLSHVAAALASPGSPVRWKPQVVHAHDWQAGLAPAYLGLWGGERAADLTGILNGIAVDAWDPATDPHIAAHYRPTTLWRKAANKAALQQEFGLAERDDVPLFAIVSRLTHQKGIDLVLAIADELAAIPAQLVVLGAGERAIAEAVAALPERRPGQFGARIGFDEGLAHRIEAGADMFLMPSRFEPCGMNQMYSQRYGTPPIVHATGGLADSVDNCTPDSLAAGAASGFAFGEPTADALWAAVARSIALWHRPRLWRKLQKTAMSRDFSWAAAAARYGRVYESLAARPR